MKHILIDMTGYKAEFFRVMRKSDKKDRSNCAYWYCLCVCGRLFEARGHDIRRKRQKSCGCQTGKGFARKHGALAKNASREARKTYTTWSNILSRCLNPKSTGYRYYGAKGVRVADRWNPKAGGSFANFLADMGCRPKGRTIGRSLDTGNYEPGNCCWQTRKQQGDERIYKRLILKLGTDYPELIPEIPLYGLVTGSPQLNAC